MKIGGFADQFRNWLLRPQIVHRLPGRLRLRVPALKQIDHTQREWASAWQDLLCSAAEIESVEVSLATGSILIRYDPDQLTEAELIAFLRAVNRLALQHWDELAASTPAQRPQALQRLVGSIRSGIRFRRVPDDKLEVSTDA
jgi:hypothetical protein